MCPAGSAWRFNIITILEEVDYFRMSFSKQSGWTHLILWHSFGCVCFGGYSMCRSARPGLCRIFCLQLELTACHVCCCSLCSVLLHRYCFCIKSAHPVFVSSLLYPILSYSPRRVREFLASSYDTCPRAVCWKSPSSKAEIHENANHNGGALWQS